MRSCGSLYNCSSQKYAPPSSLRPTGVVHRVQEVKFRWTVTRRLLQPGYPTPWISESLRSFDLIQKFYGLSVLVRYRWCLSWSYRGLYYRPSDRAFCRRARVADKSVAYPFGSQKTARTENCSAIFGVELRLRYQTRRSHSAVS